MKILASILVIMFSVGIYAQDVKPEFIKEGKLVKATFFHDNGSIAQKGYIRYGKLHGEWVMYDSEGQRIALGEYVEGKRTGDWFFWKPTGEAMREVVYVHGRPVQIIVWDKRKAIL